MSEIVASPAPQLSSRRNQTKVGSRVPALAIATSGEGAPASPAAPATPKVSVPPTPKGKEVKMALIKFSKVDAKPTEGKDDAPESPAKSCLKSASESVVMGVSSGVETPATPASPSVANTPRLTDSSCKRLYSCDLHSSLTSPPPCFRARSRPVADDGVPAAGSPYKSRYAVPRSTIRNVPGKSQPSSDVLCLKPQSSSILSPRVQSKRTMAVAYSPTRLAYSNSESQQHLMETRRGGKYCADVHSPEAPWEHNQFKEASPRRAGSARPTVYTATTPPWAKPDDGTWERSTRSHTAAAAVRSKDAPYGVTDGSDIPFRKGEDKVVQHTRLACARPTSGKACSMNPGHNDVLNPNADVPKASPTGRRAPPASAIAPSEEYVRPLCRKMVDQPEHDDRPIGKRGCAMATAACEASPFRTERDDARQANLSREQAIMGSQPLPISKPFSKVFIEGRSGGVQSMHIDPSNVGAINSKFSPPRELPPTSRRHKVNVESVPGTDRDSRATVCPVRYGRNKESLVGVMSPAPQRAPAQYTIIPPFWTTPVSAE